MANAPFQIHSFSLYSRGGCFWGHVLLSQHVSCQSPTRLLAQGFSLGNRFSPFRRKESAALHTPAARCRSRRCRGGGLGPGGGSGFGWSALLLLALLAWCCLLLVCLPALRCAALLLGSFLLQRGTPFWFVFVPAEGNRFALGTGGIRWSLLVGGLGPVLSIPKLCFKLFRILETNT